MVLGETEIFGQVKTAYQMALDAGVTAACANKTFQKAFTIGKRVRTDSQIHAGATSVGSVAVELAEQIFGDLGGTRVLILGAGDMSRVTGRALRARGAEGIYVANRSFDRAVELAGMIGGQAIRYDVWGEYLRDIDVVVAATAAPTASSRGRRSCPCGRPANTAPCSSSTSPYLATSPRTWRTLTKCTFTTSTP